MLPREEHLPWAFEALRYAGILHANLSGNQIGVYSSGWKIRFNQRGLARGCLIAPVWMRQTMAFNQTAAVGRVHTLSVII